MPSHAMKSFTLLACGEAGQGVDIGGVTFLRPRANTPRSGQDAFCLGGYVRNFEPAMTISAVSRDQPDSRAITQSLDQRGHFCFDRLTPGVYKVWSNKASGAERHDRRGLLVEVGADTTNLVLG